MSSMSSSSPLPPSPPASTCDCLAGPALAAAVEFLCTVPLLAPMLKAEIDVMARRSFQEFEFGDGEVICEQGTEGDGMYILRRGEATALLDGAPVKRYKQAQFFGEIALLRGGRRMASVVSAGPSVCLKLHKAAFAKLHRVGPCAVILERQSDKILNDLGDGDDDEELHSVRMLQPDGQAKDVPVTAGARTTTILVQHTLDTRFARAPHTNCPFRAGREYPQGSLRTGVRGLDQGGRAGPAHVYRSYPRTGDPATP